MATGIRDKVAIIGMGCTRFGERWDVGAEELMVEAYEECIKDAGIEPAQIGAAWLGTCIEEISVGKSALAASVALRLPNIGVTRTENFCATGTEAFRGACYAVASGAYDICLAIGVEKLKDTGYGGLPDLSANAGTLNWLWFPNLTAPGAFAMLAQAYCAKYGVADDDLKLAMAHVSAKSQRRAEPEVHRKVPSTGSSPRRHRAPARADAGVSDGAACAIVTTPRSEKARQEGPVSSAAPARSRTAESLNDGTARFVIMICASTLALPKPASPIPARSQQLVSTTGADHW